MMFKYGIFLILTIGLSTADVINVDELMKENFEHCITNEGDSGVCINTNLCRTDILAASPNSSDTHGVIKKNVWKCDNDADVCCRLSIDKQKQGCGFWNPDGFGPSTGEAYSKPGEFPWTIAILKKVTINHFTLNVFVGGGALIHPNVVLTAAHVVRKAMAMVIRAGEWDTNSTSETYSHQDRDIAEVLVHENFNPSNVFNNIALLLLKSPLVLTPNVRPICLPKQDDNPNDGERCYASGWGKDISDGKQHTVMKKVELPVVDNNKCQSRLRKTRLGIHFKLNKSFMCAGGEVGKDTCRGDGGSPLACPIANEPNRFRLSGIVAWGIECGTEYPSVYANVARFRNWIEEKLSEKGYDTSYLNY